MPDGQLIERPKKNGSVGHRFTSTNQPVKNGRPAEVKDKLTYAFLRGLSEDFEKRGQKTIEALREKDPATYIRVIASLVPKEFTVTRTLDGVDDDKLAMVLDLLMKLRAPEAIEAEVVEIKP